MKSRINGVGMVLGGMKVLSCRANVKRKLYEAVFGKGAIFFFPKGYAG